MKTLILISTFIFSLSSLLSSQIDSITISLSDLIAAGLSDAFELNNHNIDIKESLLQKGLFDEQQKPNFYFDGILPNLSRAIETRPLPDGRDAFVNRSTMYNSLGVRGDYKLPRNFGTLTAESRIQRLDILRTNTLPYSRNYFVTPIKLGYQYTPFRFDETKWEEEKQHITNKKLTLEKGLLREELIAEMVEKYCLAYETQEDIALLEKAKEENRKLYQIQSRLYDLGSIGKIEMLRLQLENEKLIERVDELQTTLSVQKISLNEYLQIANIETQALKLAKPETDIPSVLTSAEVLAAFSENEFQNYKNYVLQKELQSEIDRIDQNKDISFSIKASAGANNTSRELDQILLGMQDQENLGISFTVPLNGYKEREINLQLAQEQYYQQDLAIERERFEIEMQLRTYVVEFENLQKRLTKVEQRLLISNDIYDLSRREYLSGTLPLSDLNDARTQLTSDSNESIGLNLRLIRTYFLIRSVCLFDFVENQSLVE